MSKTDLEARLVQLQRQRATAMANHQAARSERFKDMYLAQMDRLEADITSVEQALARHQ